MDIIYAIERVKELKQQKKQIENSLELLTKGYTIEPEKKYRVNLVEPELNDSTTHEAFGDSAESDDSEANKAPAKTRTPRGPAVYIQLNDALVEKLISQELEVINKELELISPIINEANNLVREALQSIN